MSSDVVLTSALRNNLLSLQNTQRLIDSTQLRLATGLKVNSALDNPTSFFTAQSLNNRATDLTRLLDNINLSIRTIEEADKGITALTTLVEQAQSIAEEAQSAALAAQGFASITSTADLSAVDDLIADSGGALTNGDDFVITVKRDGVATPLSSGDINIATGDTVYDLAGTINSNTTINQYVRASVDSSGRLRIESLEEGALIRISDGTTSPGADGYAFLGLDGLVATEDTVATTRQGGTAVAGRTIKSQAALAATAVNDVYQSSAALDAAGFIDNFGTAGTDDVTITFTVDGVATDIGSYVDTSTIQDIIDDVNAADVGVTASFDTSTGQIVFTADDSVSELAINIRSNDGTSTGDIAFGFGTGVTGYGTVGGATDITLAANDDAEERFVFSGSSVDLVQFQDDFNELRNQIDGLVEDASFRGVNLLNGDDLTTFFNEDRSNSLVTEGVDFSALGLGIGEAEFTNSATVQVSIDAARAALDSVRNFGNSIANDLAVIQTRRDFTENTINTLQSGADDLTVADQNEEGANLLALQTRQALGVTSLSLASQSQQAVLRLF